MATVAESRHSSTDITDVRVTQRDRGLGVSDVVFGRSMRRVAHVIQVSVSYAFRFVARRSRRPEILRTYLQTLGGAFVKLGQVLAMRYDMLPARYCEELAILLDRLPPVPYAEIEAIIEHDLARSCADLFDGIDPVPVSTASVAQVHRGALPDGQQVAIKVMRPGVRALYRTDLALLRIMVRLVTAAHIASNLDLEGFVSELTELANEELDFGVEARHAAILRESLAGDATLHYVPKVFPDLSGPRVLTLEWLEGVSVNALLRAVDRSDADLLQEFAAHGADPKKVGRTLCESIITQCFAHRVFHADPHAANLIVLQDGRLGYVDFGMIGWIDERTWRRHLRLNLSIATGDLDGAYQALLEMVEPLPRRNLRRFERAFKQRLQRWIFAARVPTSSLRERSVARFFADVFPLMRAEGLRMPSGDMRLNRALFIADIVVLKLCPEMLRLPLLERFFKDELTRLVETATRAQYSLRGGYDSLFAMVDTPGALSEFSQSLRTRARASDRESWHEQTRLESATLVALRYIRLCIAIAVALVAASGVAGWFSLSFRPGLLLAYVPSPWIAVAAGGVLLVILGRVMRVLR